MTEPKKLAELMPLVMSDIGAVGKDSHNPHFNYNFRGIDAVMNAVHRSLVKHGVFFVPQIINKEYATVGKQRHALVDVVYAFHGPAGDEILYGPYSGEGLDTADKATNKALSAALKYLLLHGFCIPTEDEARDDADSQGNKVEWLEEAGSPSPQTSQPAAKAAALPPQESEGQDHGPAPSDSSNPNRAKATGNQDPGRRPSDSSTPQAQESNRSGRMPKPSSWETISAAVTSPHSKIDKSRVLHVTVSVLMKREKNEIPQEGLYYHHIANLPEDALREVVKRLGLVEQQKMVSK